MLLQLRGLLHQHLIYIALWRQPFPVLPLLPLLSLSFSFKVLIVTPHFEYFNAL